MPGTAHLLSFAVMNQ